MIHTDPKWAAKPDVGEAVPIKAEYVEVLGPDYNDSQTDDFKADFRWRCPECERTTVLAFKGECATIDEITADGRCCYCRKGISTR